MIRKTENQYKRHKKPLVKFGKRLKKRHYLIEFIFVDPKDEQMFLQRYQHNNATEMINNCFIQHFIKYWGEYGRTLLFQRPSFRVIYINIRTHMCIIQIPHSIQQMFSSCLPFLKEINGKNVILRVLHIAGTIRTLKQVAIIYHNKWIREIREMHANTEKAFEGQDFIPLDDEDDKFMMDDEEEIDKEVAADTGYVETTMELLTMTSSDQQKE